MGGKRGGTCGHEEIEQRAVDRHRTARQRCRRRTQERAGEHGDLAITPAQGPHAARQSTRISMIVSAAASRVTMDCRTGGTVESLKVKTRS